jgi:hypothetical protein
MRAHHTTRRYPEGVKLVTLSFADHFGSAFGAQVRQWCEHWQWALAWVLHSDTTALDARRLLDPAVVAATTVNVTVDAGVATQFDAAWAAAAASRGTTPTNFSNYAAVWAALVNETSTPGVGDALTWGIGVRDCQDYDNCFGLQHSSGRCVCYLNRTDFQP